MSRDAPAYICGLAVFNESLAVRLACGDQCRLTGSGSTLQVLHNDVLYESTYFTLFALLHSSHLHELLTTATDMSKPWVCLTSLLC